MKIDFSRADCIKIGGTMSVQFDQQITFIYTEDLAETSRFYEEWLGLELVLDQGLCRIVKVREGAYIGYCQRSTSREKDGIILTLVTENVDEWYERLSEFGVKFEKTPTFSPEYNIYHCFFRDPNGYLLEIQRFIEPLLD
jgi:catechol 2,3-dioxygenase-like lactoylglutathione lyase family enzyme